MGQWINYKGQRFGRLVVISDRIRRNKQTYYLCQCDCGNIKEVRVDHLKSGATQSCGCLHKEKVRKNFLVDITGQRFGNLIALEQDISKKQSNAYWLCKCDCGSIVSVRSADLRNGHTLSCGCLGMSKGEYILKQLFQDNKIPFKTQVSYSDLKGVGLSPLYFDFEINFNNSSFLIEFQGIQHYEPTEYFGGQTAFERQVQNDNIKKEYCKNHNLNLLIIPYWDIDKINLQYIKEKINEYNN